MPQSTNLNVTPYYDDFDSNKDFYRVLFRPGYSIQSRELTTLQSVLQNQVESVGKYLMKEGSMVVPGEVSFNNSYAYVKISSFSQGFTLSQFLGATLTGETTGVVAKVLNATEETSADSATFFVRYESSGTATTNRRFQEGEILSSDIVGSPTAVVGITGSARPTVYRPFGSAITTELTQNTATGNGSAVFIQEGIYYVNGHFVRNAAQTLIVDKYSTTPTCRVGFLVQEELVTPDEDNSLNDNAAGFSNYAAPGAHRLKITLTLASRLIDAAVENNFIELLRIRDGIIERKVEKKSWSDIEEILARRTYDESGDYVVRNYGLEIKNHNDDGENNGVYPLSNDGTYNGLSLDDSKDSIVAAISPGKAYVRGYEIESTGTKFKTFDRARDTLTRERASISVPQGAFLNVQNVFGSIDLDNIVSGSVSTEALSQLKFYGRFTDSYLGLSSGGRGSAPLRYYLVQIENLDAQATFDWTDSLIGGMATSNQQPSDKTGNIVEGSILRGADAPAGTAQNGITSGSNARHVYTMLVSLTSGDFIQTGTTVQDVNTSNVSSGTDRAIVRRVDELSSTPIGCAHAKYLSSVSTTTDSNGLISGKDNRDSIFRLGIFDTTTFTSLKVHSNITVGAYASGVKTYGAKITGSSSGATGIVEASYSDEGWDEIVLSNVIGTFKDGELIVTDPDYGNEGRRAQARIIKNGTIKSIKVLDGGSGYSQIANPTATTELKIGPNLNSLESVRVDRAVGGQLFPYKLDVNSIGGLMTVELDDGESSGDIFPNKWHFKSDNATVYSGVPVATITMTTGTAALLEVDLWGDTVRTYTMKDIKSISGGAANSKFSADTILDNENFFDSIEIAQVNGKASNTYFEITSLTADPRKNLKTNDLIKVVSDAGFERRYSVKYVQRRGTLLTNTSRVYVYGPIVDDVTNAQLFKIEARIGGADKNTLVLKTPDSVVKTTAKDKTETGFNFNTFKQFISTIGSGSLTFTLSGENRDFDGFSNRYTAVVANAGTSSGLSVGDIIDLSLYENQRTLATGGTNGQIVFSGLPSAFNGAVIKLTAPISIRNARPRTKILKNAQLAVSTYNKKEIINLGKVDGFRLNAVYMSADPDASALVTDIDIKERFIFDNGQRDNVYDIARLIRKKGSEEPSGQLLVDFTYFDHSSNDGEFFSVDSYLNANNITLLYDDIPVFYSEKSGAIQLRDAIDFRPSADIGAGTSTTGYVPGAEDKGELGALRFTTVDTFIPVPGDSFELTYDFYLPRKDSVYLTRRGNFEVVQGVPSIRPEYPQALEESIRLFDLDVPAYTFAPSDVAIKVYNYKRYTMKDIRKLEDRIERMEYYTTLSLLEQDTLNTSIKDAVTGLDRFKSGIVVDNFSGHNVGDTFSNEYKCAIDMQSQQLRPQHFTNQVSLREQVTDDASRASKGYKKAGSLITLDYTEQEFIKNPFATETINLNPFLVFQYKGSLTLDPPFDEWKDTERRPNLVVNDNNLFDTIQNMADENGVLGTVWNEWQTSWSGQQELARDTSSSGNLMPWMRDFQRNLPNNLRIRNPNGSGRTRDLLVAGVTVNTTTSVMGRTRTRTRQGTQNRLAGSNVVQQSFGDRVVGMAFQPNMRAREVRFTSTALKPNTRLYAFFEGIDVSAWVCPDANYTGEALNSPKGFGQPIITDDNGNVSGVFIIPNGAAPLREFTTNISNELATRGISDNELDRRRVSTSSSDSSYNLQRYTGNLDDIIYDTSSATRTFRVGERTFRLTSSSVNSEREVDVDTFSEAEYFAMGLMETVQETIVSTRVPTITQRSVSEQDQTQFVDGVRTNQEANTNYFDPVAQTFMVEGYQDGMFLSSLEVFFKTKSETVPTRCYLTETLLGTPGKKTIPFSEVTINPTTKLKIVSDSAVSFVAGETVIGLTSGANGTVKTNLEITGTTTTVNFSNTTYTLELSNHNGIDFQPGEVLSIQRFPEPTSIVNIARNSFQVASIEMVNTGETYTTASVTIGAPQQVGGVQATAYAKIDARLQRIVEIVVTNPGSGYTSEPSVSIEGDGAGATAISRIRGESHAVEMGVGTSDDASVGTKFKFPSPIYLENNTEYAFVVVSNSIDYNMYISRLGENEIGTTQRVSTQPYLGSLFKSQNSTLWTADQFEDVKFTLNRAKFSTTSTASVDLVNDKMPFIRMGPAPFETNKLSYRGGNSIGESIYSSASAPSAYADNLFGSNPRVVRVSHKNHGMSEGDYVILKGVQGVGTGDALMNGIAISKMNSIHQILNVGMDSYDVLISKDPNSQNDQATESGRGGGVFAYATENQQFQTLQPQVTLLQFPSCNVSHTIDALKADSIDYDNPNAFSTETISVVPGRNTYLTDNYAVLSEINEIYRNDGRKSLKYNITMSTTNDAVSPVLDLDRVSLFTVSNRIDKPMPNQSRFGYKVYRLYPFDNTPSLGGTAEIGGIGIGSVIQNVYKVDPNGVRNFVTGSIESASTGIIQAEVVGINQEEKYIDIRYLKIPTTNVNSASGELILQQGMRFAPPQTTGSLTPYVFQVVGASTDYYLQTDPIDRGGFLYRTEEEGEMGSHSAKYQTKTVNLENPATNIDVRLTANLFANKDIQVMYRIRPTSSDKIISSQPWRYFNPKFTEKSSIRSIEITNGGAGYTTAPAVTLEPANGAEVTPVIDTNTNTLTNILVTKRGSGFLSAPRVIIDSNTGGTGNALTGNQTLTSGGAGYVQGSYSSVAAIYDPNSPTNLPSAGSGATFDITVDANGNVSGVVLNSAGVGYKVGEYLTFDPAFDGAGGGSGVQVTVANVTAAGAPTELAVAEAFIFPVDFDEETSGLADNADDIEVDDSDILDPSQEFADSFKEYKFTVEDLPEFSEFSVKIIMRLNDEKGPAYVPKIEDLRCIASA